MMMLHLRMKIGHFRDKFVAQFDIFENANKATVKRFPFLLEIQSDVFEESTRAVYVPLVDRNVLKKPDKVLNVSLNVLKRKVRLFPLDIASARRDSLGTYVCNVRDDGDSIIAALDLLFARY